MTICIIYASSSDNNKKYIKEAERSAESFRKFFPDAHFVLYTNCREYERGIFDEIKFADFQIPPKYSGLTEQSKQWLCGGQLPVKMQAMIDSQYDRNLYIGSDTLAVSPEVSRIFDLLDKFDVAVSHAPYRVFGRGKCQDLDNLPDVFPEFNGDLILFRNQKEVKDVIKQWRTMYIDKVLEHPHDQGSLRYLMYNSKLRIATLPPEYNYRGRGLRANTVIMQNRDLIETYIMMNEPGNYFKKVRTKLFDKICLMCDPILSDPS